MGLGQNGVACPGQQAGENVAADPATALDGAYRWYAVHCQPHREHAAAAHLRNQDYHVFLPWQRKTRRHARRVERVLRPFFPSYLFLRLDPARDRWRAVNSTFGVVRMVMQGDKPAPAPVGVIETLRDCCDADDILEWQPALELGQAVRVTAGPFADLVGELQRLDGAKRVCVLLDLMGGTVPAWLPRSDVVPAASLF